LEKRSNSDRGNNFASSAWDADENDNNADNNRRTGGEMQQQPQHNFTGVRINMAGELLGGMKDHNSNYSEDLFDSVEMDIMEEEKHWRKQEKESPEPIKQKETTTSTTKDYDEEEARKYAEESIEITFDQRIMEETKQPVPSADEGRKKRLRGDRFRFWKYHGPMVAFTFFVMCVFLFLTFWTRFQDKQLSWD